MIFDKEVYQEQLKRLENYPEIKNPHIADWPIKSDPAYLSNYFGFHCYTDPDLIDPHSGIDIQTHFGAEVLAFEDCRFLYSFEQPGDPKDNMINLVLLGLESRISYGLGHIDSRSISLEKDSIIKRGQSLGKVAKWPDLLEEEIPENIERIFGKEYNHIHVSTHPFLSFDKVPYGDDAFNPLLVFKKLPLAS